MRKGRTIWLNVAADVRRMGRSDVTGTASLVISAATGSRFVAASVTTRIPGRAAFCGLILGMAGAAVFLCT